MREPTKKDLLDEIRRLRAENERLTRLAATQRPELQRLRAIEVGLRGIIHARELADDRLKELHAECRDMLPGNDDLPSLSEIGGICSKGKERVDHALDN